MENKNNNGRGLFYGVIGVATLVVAIIGATFAYFTASITRNNAITNVASTELTLGFTPNDDNFRTDMIPVDADGNGAAFAKFPGMIDTASAELDSDDLAAGNTCRDLVGNSICSAYQFTISNESSTTAQTVVGSMTVVLNEFDNLHYALFKGTSSAIYATDDKFNVDKTATATATSNDNWITRSDAAVGTLIHKGNLKTEAAAVGTEGQDGYKPEGLIKWPNTLEQLTPTTDTAHNTTTYTVIVWLEEAGAANDDEQGANFTASITFTSDTGAGGVTGVLTGGA